MSTSRGILPSVLAFLILLSWGCSTAHFTKYSVDTHEEDGVTFITYEYVRDHVLKDPFLLAKKAQNFCEGSNKNAHLYGGGPIVFSFGLSNRIYVCATQSDLRRLAQNPD